MIGTAPDVVNHLSPEEMSCISLVRNTAHIFTYMGGEATELKGWHSMNEVDLTQVQRTLRGMDHKTLGFPDNNNSFIWTYDRCAVHEGKKKNKCIKKKNAPSTCMVH